MGVFVGLLMLGSLIRNPGGPSWRAAPEYWLYPIQTVLCGALLFWFWRRYDFGRPRKLVFTIAVAVIVFLLWIAPQQFFGAAPRRTGFDPSVFQDRPEFYWASVGLRFLRLVVFVPLVEEIFWRGFLLRYLIRERFWELPVGTFSWLSFVAVTAGFGFSHSRADWVAALVTGMLYNLIAYRTKSLASCVVAHALTNLLLGIWIMTTRQWGFW